MTFDQTEPDLATNLAFDEALLVAAEEGTGPGSALRFWELDHSAVVLGASCRLRENVRIETCRSEGVPIGRRSSGGGTVVLGPGVLCATIVRPVESLPDGERSVDRAQRWILERTGAALRGIEPGVTMLGSGDLTLQGRKFVGSAQRRLRHSLMIHFCLLYDFELSLIDHYLLMPPRQPEYRQGRPHADFVTNLNQSRVAIVAAIEEVWGGQEWGSLDQVGSLTVRAGMMTREKFRDHGWIERL